MPDENSVGFPINLMIDGADGAGVYVRSNEVPGLHLIGKNLIAMKPIIEKAIVRLFKDNRGLDVRVLWLAEVGTFKADPTITEHLAVYPVKKAA